MIKIIDTESMVKALVALVVLTAKLVVKITLICLVLSALWWGLPTTWGTVHIDIFPVGVYLR